MADKEKFFIPIEGKLIEVEENVYITRWGVGNGIWRNAIKIMGFCPTMLWIRMEWSDWKCLKIQLSIV